MKNLRPKLLVWLLRALSLVAPVAILLVPSLARLQFGPAAARCLAAFGVDALLIACAWLLFTFALGRFYCKIGCPLGTIQAIFGALSFRRHLPQPDRPWLRWTIALLAWGLLLGGWATWFSFLDPFSLFTRITAIRHGTAPGRWPLVLSLALLAAFYALCFWKRRFFCNHLCPVGTILGGIAHISPLGLHIHADRCVRCAKCAKHCPAGCIDLKHAAIDNGRCIRCLQCLAACDRGAIAFGPRPAPAESPVSLDRRHALAATGILAGGVLLGWRLHPGETAPLPEAIVPPGAGSPARLLSRCTTCLLCVQHCPQKILQPPTAKIPFVHLDYGADRRCAFDCHRCSELCPTGAIRPIPLAEKRRTRIAQAHYDENKCIDCEQCIAACPTHAMHLRDGMPFLQADACIGCNACAAVCPAQAISIHPIRRQETAAAATPPPPPPKDALPVLDSDSVI